MTTRRPFPVASMPTGQPSGDAPLNKGWLITFTDLVSLLLAFFVLLFSMSKVQQDKWENVINALSKRLSADTQVSQPRPLASLNVDGVDSESGVDLGYLKTLLENRIRKSSALSGVLLYELTDRLIVSLPSELLFARAEARLAAGAETALAELGSVLRNVNNGLAVYGHTDPVPYTGTRFASNWELSLARAVSVSNELRRAGYTRDIVAFGLADSRFATLSDQLPHERRQALARRVDIVVNKGRGDGR